MKKGIKKKYFEEDIIFESLISFKELELVQLLHIIQLLVKKLNHN